MLISTLDRRWSAITKERTMNHFKRINPKIVMNISDSGDSSHMQNTWLPRGILSIIIRKYTNFVVEELLE